MSAEKPIAVAEPRLDGREADYVRECLETNWISSKGRFIEAFETAFADYCGVAHAISTNNGTTSLHLALHALGIGPGDEVIVPSMTYIASANTVRYCGAEPVFVDCDPVDYNLSVADVARRITPRTRAIMPVHVYGRVADMSAIRELAQAHSIAVVEDAAEAVGARQGGRRTGGLGDCASFSFFGNKIITTGEGGMVTTDDGALAARMRLLRNQGMDPARRYWFPEIGFNYRMTNIAAAIGLGQLERIEHHLAARDRVAAGYNVRLAEAFRNGRLVAPRPSAPETDVCWMYTVQIPQGPSVSATAERRDRVMAALADARIETRPVFIPLHTLPPYAEAAQRQAEMWGGWPDTEACSAAGINLPTHGGLDDDDLDRISACLLQTLGNL